MNDWINYFKNTGRSLYSESIRNRRLIELIIQHTPLNGKILEAGCGTALLSVLLADIGFSVTAMDYNVEVVDYAKKRCGLSLNNLEFIRGDILNLSLIFKPMQFDTIYHSGVLEHFSDTNIIKSLNEHRKVSKRVIFNVPNSRCKMGPGFFGDERLMNNFMWTKLIKNAGYDSVKIYGGYDLPRFLYLILPGAFFTRRLSFWWKWMSKHSVFFCE